MSYHYIDAKREKDPRALPDVEVYQACTYCQGKGTIYQIGWANPEDCPAANCDGGQIVRMEGDGNPIPVFGGWFYSHTTPDCPCASIPVGPFETEAEALKEAREAAGYCEHGIAEDEICEECPAPELYAVKSGDLYISYQEYDEWPADIAKASVWTTREAAEVVARQHGIPIGEPGVVKLSDADARRWGRGSG